MLIEDYNLFNNYTCMKKLIMFGSTTLRVSKKSKSNHCQIAQNINR